MSQNLFAKSAIAVLLAVPMFASAESQLTVGAGNAAAKLDFRVVIPRVLFLGVGTGAAALSTTATVDRVTFDYSSNAAAVGSGAVAGAITNSGGFASNAIPVRVFGNTGQVVLTATNPANLTSGTDTIPFTQFGGASSAGTLALPAFSGGTTNVTLSSGKVTDRSATWTFTYANTVAAAAGTYDGQVTYTASAP